MKKIATIACMLALTGCGVDPGKAKRILEGQGMTDVVIGGYAFWGCSDKDTFKSSFTAKDIKGQPVSGVICSGMLKGYTVRFD